MSFHFTLPNVYCVTFSPAPQSFFFFCLSPKRSSVRGFPMFPRLSPRHALLPHKHQASDPRSRPSDPPPHHAKKEKKKRRENRLGQKTQSDRTENEKNKGRPTRHQNGKQQVSRTRREDVLAPRRKRNNLCTTIERNRTRQRLHPIQNGGERFEWLRRF